MPLVAEPSDAIVIQPETPTGQRIQIYVYIGFLFLVVPFTGLWGTSARFFLKDNLHMDPNEVANFLFLASAPGYVGFIFGFVRDRWNPFGRRDQGILILFLALSCLLLFGAALTPTTTAILLTVFFASSIIGQFLASALQGLTSVLGQERLMSGRLSSVWQSAAAVPALAVSYIAGYLAEQHNVPRTFAISGAVALCATLFTSWRPQGVFDAAETAPIVPKQFWQEALRLAKTPALYPIIVLLLIWNFTPGLGTPIQFYLTDTLHGTASDLGRFNAIFNGFFIPSYLLYGYLCSRVRLRPLIWVCTAVAVPQILPLLMVHNANTAMWAAVPMGLMGGPATAAYFDLLIRACPAGLQGTAMMLGASAWLLSGELGNIAGARLYTHYHSFAPCAWATAIIYAFLIPVFAFVPKHLTARRDGEVPAT